MRRSVSCVTPKWEKNLVFADCGKSGNISARNSLFKGLI
jgi:hypothetical protein